MVDVFGKEAPFVQRNALLEIRNQLPLGLWSLRIQRVLDLHAHALEGPGVYPAVPRVNGEPARLEQEYLVVAQQLSQTVQRGVEGTLCQVTVSVGPERVGQALLGYVLPAEGYQRLQ